MNNRINDNYFLSIIDRTKFEIVYELDKYGADIFMRNKDLKTCFQHVNCNQLMLKIVKKLERK